MAVVVAVAAWLVASPAWAAVSKSAPQCDHRGATTFGPTPTLDPPTASVDIGQADDGDCARALLDNAYEQGDAPTPDVAHASLEAVLSEGAVVLRAPVAPEVNAPAHELQAPRGVRQQVERPPRTAVVR